MNHTETAGVDTASANPSGQLAEWLAGQCAAIADTRSAVLVLGAPDTGPFVPVAFWPAGRHAVPQLVDVAEQALEQRAAVRALLAPGVTGLAMPVKLDGHLHGVFALELTLRSDAALQQALDRMQASLVWLEAWQRRQDSAVALSTEARLMAVLDVLGAVLEEERFKPACRTMATELAGRLYCDRVSLGVVRGGRAEVVALSHSAQVGKRMSLTHALGAAMDEAIDQRALIRHPAAAGDDLLVVRDHERLAAEHGNGSLLTIPMAGGAGFEGALLLERPARSPFQQAELDLAQSVAAVLGRILELKQLNERSLAARTADAGREQLRRLVGPRHVKRKLAVVAVLVATIFFLFATDTYRVTAPATLEGAVRRTVAAPFDGYVATAPMRAGDVARAGAVLATLDDREIRLERMKWASQYGQYFKQYQEAVANRDRAKSKIEQAQYEQAQAQVAMLDSQLQRAAVLAPFDGVIVAGDLTPSLGSAVKRGDTLFEIAPLAGYRVIVNVDERDIAAVRSGQHGALVLSSITGESLPFTVGNVTSVTTAKEGRTYFRVEAMLGKSADRLRPGMEGVAKINIEERNLFWIWTHRVSDWLRLFFWTYGS